MVLCRFESSNLARLALAAWHLPPGTTSTTQHELLVFPWRSRQKSTSFISRFVMVCFYTYSSPARAHKEIVEILCSAFVSIYTSKRTSSII